MSVGRHLSRLGNEISVSIPSDPEGFVDRECPAPSCLKVFKVKPGTGLPDATDCICPYCGHSAASDQFFTRSQIDYATQVASARVHDAIGSELEDMARQFPRGGLVSMRVERGTRTRPRYRHITLPTSLRCESCTCEYKVEGPEGKCPDCGQINGGTSNA